MMRIGIDMGGTKIEGSPLLKMVKIFFANELTRHEMIMMGPSRQFPV
ncbi:MAG: hypothetical protein CM1200mP30_31090 [Pseudomonadota bacterium]|nr:MAG: hypothetical protein CM1200mP30_31090 [Pseudomonadota bacterium]